LYSALSVKVSDLLKDPAAFKQYMETLGLSEEVAAAIIDGSISLEMVCTHSSL